MVSWDPDRHLSRPSGRRAVATASRSIPCMWIRRSSVGNGTRAAKRFRWQQEENLMNALMKEGSPMPKKKAKEGDSIGYKKPPLHTQFKPGQSGNPKGRPKKVATLPEVVSKELRARVPIVSNGKRKKISLLEAIVKQHLNKAAGGDSKAAALVFKHLREIKSECGDNLSEFVQEFRSLHHGHRAVDKHRSNVSDGEAGEEERQ